MSSCRDRPSLVLSPETWCTPSEESRPEILFPDSIKSPLTWFSRTVLFPRSRLTIAQKNYSTKSCVCFKKILFQYFLVSFYFLLCCVKASRRSLLTPIIIFLPKLPVKMLPLRFPALILKNPWPKIQVRQVGGNRFFTICDKADFFKKFDLSAPRKYCQKILQQHSVWRKQIGCKSSCRLKEDREVEVWKIKHGFTIFFRAIFPFLFPPRSGLPLPQRIIGQGTSAHTQKKQIPLFLF